MGAANSPKSSGFEVPNLPSRIPSLDGLRAASIALVLIGHSAFSAGAPKFLMHVEHLGNFGVRCFFIISGFLITTLLLKEIDKTGTVSLTGFYIRRALRIFPPSLVYIAVIASCAALGWLTLKPGDLVHALTYTMNYHYRRAWWFDHLWSLSVEEQFYLLWPGLLYLAGARRGLKIAWGVIFFVPVIRALMWFAFHATDSAMTKHFEANADALSTGCLLCMNFNRLGANRSYQRFQASLLFWIFAPGLVLAGQALFVVSPAAFYILGQTLANIGTALCIDWSVRNYDKGIGRLLNWKPIVFVGSISYSLYLWQNAFLNSAWDGWPARFPINFLFIFVIGIASYFSIEQPFMRLKRFIPHNTTSPPNLGV